MDQIKLSEFIVDHTKIKRKDRDQTHLDKHESQVHEQCPDCGIAVTNRVVYYYQKKKQWTKECQKCGIRASVYIK